MIHRLPLGLFGRHVLRRGGHLAGKQDSHIVDRPGQTEVRNLYSFDAVVQQNVGGLTPRSMIPTWRCQQ